MTSRNSSESDGQHDRFGVRNVVAGYDAEASTLVPEYERLPFEEIHAPVLDLVPESAGCVLDVGAGSGRDAAWFVAKGHQVVAVEPSVNMRAAGKEHHQSPDIRWMDDTLPALDKVLRSKLTFDLVWLSGVWTHVPPSTRARAFRKLVSVMSPGASMMVSFRRGPPPAERPMEPATAAEVEVLARRHGLQTIRSETRADAAGRIGIWWEVIWLRLPDDGTGALPLLRHDHARLRIGTRFPGCLHGSPALARTRARDGRHPQVGTPASRERITAVLRVDRTPPDEGCSPLAGRSPAGPPDHRPADSGGSEPLEG